MEVFKLKFSISKEEKDRLASFANIAQSIADCSIKNNLYVFKPEKDTLYAIAYGNGNSVKFKSGISGLTTEPDDGAYFYADINQFLQDCEKVYVSSGTTDCKVSIENDKIIISSGKSKITLSRFDSVSMTECEEAFNSIVTKKAAFFKKDTHTLKVTSEIMQFADVVSKFITMVGSDRVTGIGIKGDDLLYSDQSFSIVNKKLSEVCTDNDKELFIPQSFFSFYSNLVKFKESFTATYADSYVLIDDEESGFQSVLSLPDIVCEYPNDEEIQCIEPDANNQYEFDVDINQLLTKMSMFDGVFPSSTWKWKTITFDLAKDSETAQLSHFNFSAEVATDLAVSNVKAVEDPLSFKIASIILYDYLNKLRGKETTVHMQVTPVSPEVEGGHGQAVVFTLPGLKFILSKILSEESE